MAEPENVPESLNENVPTEVLATSQEQSLEFAAKDRKNPVSVVTNEPYVKPEIKPEDDLFVGANLEAIPAAPKRASDPMKDLVSELPQQLNFRMLNRS